MRSSVLAVPFVCAFVLYACVGDDPEGSGSSSGGTNDAAAGDTGTSSSGGSSSGADTGADVDPDPGPHGDTLAQLEVKSPPFGGSVAPAPGGGVLVSWTHQGPTAPDVGGKTPDLTGNGAVLAKLDGTLKAEWWVTFQAAGRVVTSPNGAAYWLGAMAAGGTVNTATLRGSVGSNETFTIDGGGDGQGEEAGGAYVVIALNGDGTRRWTHVLALKSPQMNGVHFINNQTFAASDKAVLFTAVATGTLEYTDSVGNRTTRAVNNEYIVQEIDASTGRTRDLLALPQSAAHQKVAMGAGSNAFSGNGFVGMSEDWLANATGPNKRYVAGLNTEAGGALSIQNKLEASSDLSGFGSNVFKDLFPIAYASPKTPVTFSADGQPAQTFTPSAGGADAMFLLFDNTTPRVKAMGTFGGSGGETAKFVADAKNGDIYGGGQYLSSDMKIDTTTFPPPPDGSTEQAFAVRMRVDEAQGKLVPVWARHFSGTARVAEHGAAADALTGDLYVWGWLSNGKASFGMGDITSPGTGYDATHWLVKIRR